MIEVGGMIEFSISFVGGLTDEKFVQDVLFK
jgi:hypothetical protein